MDMAEDERKTYYVAVGAGQILEDPEAASFELEIRANEEELNKLQELFEETSSADEAAAFHFPGWRLSTEEQVNAAYSGQLREVYRYLHEIGTDGTKRHIESMGILDN